MGQDARELPPASERPHVLVVDDDHRLRNLLARFLAGEGMIVAGAADASEARARLKGLSFDALVVDWMMPGEDGVSLTRALRQDGAPPILMLTAKGEAADRIEGLEAGAEDYLAKPFEPRELLLRLNGIMRRRPQARGPLPALRFGRFAFDPSRDELKSDAETVRLTSAEAALLKVLAASPGETVSRDTLAERARIGGEGRGVDVHMTRLRRKLEEDPRQPRWLLTVRGEGYVLRPD